MNTQMEYKLLCLFVLIFLTYIFNVILTPAPYLPSWWDKELYTILFFVLYLLIILFVGLSVSKDLKIK